MKRDILISTAAKRYARAMLEASIKQRSFSLVLEELQLFADQLSGVPVLQKLFLNPAIPQHSKSNILSGICKKQNFHTLTQNFLSTLIRRDRLNLLEQTIVSAEQQFLEKQGIQVVEVVTAKRLNPDEERRLSQKLETIAGKKVQLENRVDPTLIGGAVTRIGTTLYDGSVQTQLRQIRAKIQEA